MDALETILVASRGKGDTEKLLADLISDVAAWGGVALVDDLEPAGHSRALIAAALQPEGTDKRTRPWLRCASLNGLDLVWLTTKSWSQVGQTNRRESPPGGRTVRHRTAPARLERWLATKRPMAEERGILLTLDRGPVLRSITEEMTQRAWSLVRQGGSAANDAGLLLTRPIPDALLIENWPVDAEALQWREKYIYSHHGSPDKPGAEMAVAVEIQYSDCATALLSQRLRAHDVAMRVGGAWQATLWVVDSQEVMMRLTRAGVFDTQLHPGHYVAQAKDVGLDEHEELEATNWPWAHLSF